MHNKITALFILSILILTACTKEELALWDSHIGAEPGYTEAVLYSINGQASAPNIDQDAKPPDPVVEVIQNHAAPPTTTTTTTTQPKPQYSVEGAIELYFNKYGPRVVSQAKKIARCESRYNPNAKSHTNDHGVFQIHAGSSGFPGGWVKTFYNVTGKPFYNSVYDAYANAEFASWLYDRSGWQPWACRYVL